MGSKTNYAETKTLDHLLGVASMTMPTVRVALFTADPGEAGSQAAEVTGGGYARQLITFSAASSGAPSSTSNSADVLFPVATSSWGTPTHFGIMDATTAGNMLYHGSITTPKAIDTDDQVKLPAGGIVITED